MTNRYIPEVASGTKSYATEDRAERRAELLISNLPEEFKDVKYIIMKADNDKFVPVFIGNQAIDARLHFHAHVLG